MEHSTARNLQRAICEALLKIGLELADVRGITTDGDRTMRKLGRNLKKSIHPKPFYHQECFAHALHLAVKNIVWPKRSGIQDPSQHSSTAAARVEETHATALVGVDADDDEFDNQGNDLLCNC